MKMKWCATGFLMLVLCASVQLQADESFEVTKAKAESGDAQAQSSLGLRYENGRGVATNYDEAFKWYNRAAAQTNAEAQFHLGICYLRGRGLPAEELLKDDKDFLTKRGLDPSKYQIIHPEIAVQWFRKAAEQNCAQAQFYLGVCYFNGNGIPQDYVEAINWFRKAAEQGVAQAQYCLSSMYFDGQGVEKNSAEAVKWCRKAAEQDNVSAQLSLGLAYIKGDGVKTNTAIAIKWFQLAADQGNVQSQYCLGLMYDVGEGVEKDTAQAVKWLRKASENGNAKAQYQLGRHYYFGDGVLVDCVEAVKWNALAAAQGNEDAVNMWNYVLKDKVPAEQIAEGQRLARQFVPHIASSGSSTPSVSNPPIAVGLPQTQGTGFFITDDGCLISNNHVVKGATKVRIVTSAGTFDAKVIQTDAANDLALLKVEGHFAALPIEASRKVSLGSTVATVGFPDPGLQGFSPKLAKGEIASLSGAGDDARYFQISVPVQPGNSGGALVDEHGNVVGIVSAKLNAAAALASSGSLPENVNYAIKSSYLLSFLESVPGVESKLKTPLAADRKFEDVVKSAQNAAVLVLVY